MGNKGSFVFYTEYREHLSMLPPEQVGELMFALMDYQETGEVPDLPKGSALAMCFSFIKKRMDKDNSKYEERCERNRSNGKKGGRPAKETDNTETEENPNKPNGFSENRTVISETEENPTEPKKADNDNEYDNDSDNEEYIHRCVVGDGDKIVINSAELAITLVKADGTQENMFRYRDKQSDVFEKISSGNHRVMWNGSFDFDLSVIHERGEPKWT